LYKYTLLIVCTFLSGDLLADEYVINAEYSTSIGLPISDIEDKVSFGKVLDSEKRCFNELNKKSVHNYALGQAMSVGAADVVLKCVKYWSNTDCDEKYLGCISKAEIGAAKHLQIYRSKLNVPEYLRLSDQDHQILQSIIYTEDHNDDGKLDVLMITLILTMGMPVQ